MTVPTAAELFSAEIAAVRELGLKFSADWWTLHGHNLIPWMKHVHTRYAGKPGLRFLEIGSLEGRSAIWVARNVLTGSNSYLTCVDHFDADYERVFDRNIAAAGVADRVVKVRGTSQERLRSLPHDGFDVIYVDGAHEEHAVRMDIELSWPLLKVGGIIVFDDYRLVVPNDGGPKPAIDAFLVAYEERIEVLDVGWQVFVQKVGP